MNAGPALRLSGVTKRHHQRVLLQAIDLTIAAGEACILTGVNGAGKSTLLRLIAGLETADEGVLASAGVVHSLRGQHPYPAVLRHAIGYVHQHPVLFNTSVAANIAYGLKLRGLRGPALRQRIEAAIEWAGVQSVAGVDPRRLSGGEKQRVALARAWALAPPVLLLDEPTANLDGAAREQVLDLIRRASAGGDPYGSGRAMLIVGHDRDVINLAGVTRYKLRDGALHRRGDSEAFGEAAPI